MDDRQNALTNITRAIAKTVMLNSQPPRIQILNGENPPEGLTLQDIKHKIEMGDSKQIEVWKRSEAEIKAAISKITNR